MKVPSNTRDEIQMYRVDIFSAMFVTFFHTNMNHQENILLFIFRNYLLLVFEKKMSLNERTEHY